MKPKVFWWWIAQIVPLLIIGGLVITYVFFQNSWNLMVQADSSGAGVFEQATVGILVIGIIFGISAIIKTPKTSQYQWLIFWLCGWVLALTYFAGEEVSWGQWQFKWETPEIFEKINKQKETNLHNTSSWLNEKPRMLVETWLVLAGLVFPLWHRFVKKRPNGESVSHFTDVLYPETFAITLTLGYLVSKILPSFNTIPWCVHLGNSEIREFFIAALLSLYLIWVYFKIRSTLVVQPAKR